MPTFRNTILKKEDFPKMTAANPAEMDLLLNSLNGMFSQLHTFFDGGIAFGDNIAAQIKQIEVQPSQLFPMEVKFTLRTTPRGVIILNAKDTTPSLPTVQNSKNTGTNQQAVSVDWTTAGDKVQIRSFGGLDPARKYSITILIV